MTEPSPGAASGESGARPDANNGARPLPIVSVVVSTFNRVELVVQLIADLESQQGIRRFEAVIVDDGSTDGTWCALQRLEREVSFPLRALRAPENLGPATGRNIGWRAASAPLIVFTDDDCRPDRLWLASMVDALRSADVVQGQTRVDPTAAAGRGPFARVQIVEQWSNMFDCCNMGYRREVLERVRGFDETFRRPWGEDTDLGWRALASGATTAWMPDALVWHRVETTGSHLGDWVSWVKDTRRKFYMPLLVRKHPEVRRGVYHRWFYRSHHPRTLLALFGIGALAIAPTRRRRWLVVVALCAPWVWHRSAGNRLPAPPRWVPVLLPLTFVGDVAEVAAMFAGSVRFRTILL
jgi:GT2 family glycosyltransferase